MPRMIDRRWTCTLDVSMRKEFLDSLWGIGVSVHTLDDHAKILTRLYKPEIRQLGEPCTVELPNMDSWDEYDPKTRIWSSLKVNNKNEKFTTKSTLGNVLKCSSIEGTSYYRINKNEDSISLIPMEKRAAFNIMCTIAEPITAHWKGDTSGQHVFIDIKELGIIPDEIFAFLKRLGKGDKKIADNLYFETEDMDIVRTALSSIKINLEKSTETIDFASSDKSCSPIPISNIEKERLDVLLDIIREMGGTITTADTHIQVSGKRGSVKVSFTDEEKSMQDGNDIMIAISALEVPSRFSEVLSTIKKKIGLSDIPLESSLASHWPILNDSDLQYVVQSAISWYGSNPLLAGKIIGENEKLDRIKEWNKKIKEGKIRSTLDTITLGKIIKRSESN
ncbi:MAG: hypothetical protein KGI25_05075 [Thaumarchaeota archaeon]|nr:hypothetical protein [Nitrososphaerota archaeon]